MVLVRVSTVIYIMPLFGARFLPDQWKIAFSVVLAVLVSFFLKAPAAGMSITAAGLFLSAIREVVIGLVIGLTTGFIFYAVMLWGQVISTQMGLGLANVIDPQAGTDISVLSQFYYMFAVVLFLSIDGHHMLIEGIVDSYIYFPLGGSGIPAGSLGEFISFSGQVFVIAVRLAASMIVLLLLVSTTLGVIARTVPQMNIFIVGFPLKLLVGLFGMVVSTPYVARALIEMFKRIPMDLAKVLGAG